MRVKAPLVIVASLVAALAVLAAGVCGLRAYFGHKYPVTSRMRQLADSSQYPTGELGTVTVQRIERSSLNGFHFTPHTRTHNGVVVVFGGSEGSPDYWRAQRLSEQGFEVLALYFFGQPGQRPTLANIPLEQFDDVTTYLQDNIDGPLTVIGTSKGAEYAATLAAHGFPITNLINFTPAQYSYPGLDFSSRTEQPSFTYRGAPVPFASFRKGDPAAGFALMRDTILNRPPSYRASYETAAAHASADSAIDLSGFAGHALFLAGDQDRMWQGDVAAHALASQSPNFAAHIYPNAGHLFMDDIEHVGNGWQILLGGTADGNAAAASESEDLIISKLTEWHGRVR